MYRLVPNIRQIMEDKFMTLRKKLNGHNYIGNENMHHNHVIGHSKRQRTVRDLYKGLLKLEA